MIELSLRLSRVASYIDCDVVLADIGSDHAYVPCFAVMNKLVSKAYACEVVEGPLKSSIKTIHDNNLSECVFPILSNGLMSVPSDMEEFVIAGMGAYTIIDILKASEDRVKSCKKGILQTNSHAELIREYLNSMNYHICNEEVLEEDGKFYEIIVFEPSSSKSLTKEEIYFGPCNLKQRTSLFISHYESYLNKLEAILGQIDVNNPKYPILKNEVSLIKEMLRVS